MAGILGVEFVLFCAAGIWLVVRPTRISTIATGTLLLALVSSWAVHIGTQRNHAVLSRESLLDDAPRLADEVGFVTSNSCRACHPSQFESWSRSFHRTMTQLASPQAVVGEFDDVALQSRGWDYRLSRKRDEFWVNLIDPEWEHLNRLRGADVSSVENPPRVDRRVVMTTGSHHMQTYWVGGQLGRELFNLPFVYLLDSSRWIAREDVFMRPPGAPPFIDMWNDNCLECHSTIGVPGLREGDDAFETRASELGIACEACHGPAEAHVAVNRNPFQRYRSHLNGDPDPTIVQPGRLDATAASEVCGQCHGVSLSDAKRWLAEGHEYRAGEKLEDSRMLVLPAQNGDHPRIQRLVEHDPQALSTRFWSDGLVRVSGREFSGMVESECYKQGELSCLTCHSMHNSDPNDQLTEDAKSDAACLGCHDKFVGRVAEHTHHSPQSSGSRCYNCHMPHTSYGLLTAMRSHTIDSPSVAKNLATGRPNACNLCHLDQTLDWTSSRLEEWYGIPTVDLTEDERHIAASVLWLLRGDAGLRALTAWSMGWAPAQAASGDRWIAPYLGHATTDPYAAVRYIVDRSVRTLPGFSNLGFDFVATPAGLAQSRQRIIEQWLNLPWDPNSWRGERTLITHDGNFRVDHIERLGRQRDDRPIFLGE